MPINFTTMHKIASAGGKWAKFTGLDLRLEGNKKVANDASVYIDTYGLGPYDAWLCAMQDYIDAIPDGNSKKRYALGMISFLKGEHNLSFSDSNVLEIGRRSSAILEMNQHNYEFRDSGHYSQKSESQKSDWEKSWEKNSSHIAKNSGQKHTNRVNPWLANITIFFIVANAIRFFGLIGGIPAIAICYFFIGNKGRKYKGSNASLVFILLITLIIMVGLQSIVSINEQQVRGAQPNEKLQNAVNTLKTTQNDSNPQPPPVEPISNQKSLTNESASTALPSEQNSSTYFQYEPSVSNETIQPKLNNDMSQSELIEEAIANGGNLDARTKSQFPAKYPPAAARNGASGKVIVQVSLDDTGKVIDVAIFRSSGNKDLDRSALWSVRKWTFYPKIEKGLPVNATTLVQIDFTL